MVKRAMGFNKQMSAVRSVLKGVTQKEFKQMTRHAMKMGATTSFTAIQAGQGMEELARKGFSAAQAMAALPHTLRLAEADSMDLKTSAEIVSSSLRQFGLDASKTARVADTLAFVSARSGTNVVALGQSLKFAGATAAAGGQSIEATAGALGMLANIGIKGSLAGTALKNMFVKLGKQGTGFTKLFGTRGKLKAALTDQKGRWKGIGEIMAKVIGKIKLIKNDADKMKVAFDLFGLRGKAAMDAFSAAMKKPAKGMSDFAKLSGVNIRKSAKGMAAEMARIRMDNLAGDFIKLKSASEGVAIGLGNMLIKSFGLRDGVKGLTRVVSKLGFAFQLMSDGADQTTVASEIGSKRIAAVAFGIREGFKGVKAGLKDVAAMFKKLFGGFATGGESTIKKITRIIAKVVGFGAALAPIGIAFGGLSTVAGGAFNVIGGGVKMVTALMSPWGLGLMLILTLFGETKKKGESTFTWLKRTLKSIANAFSPIVSAIKFLVKHVGVFGTLLGLGAAAMAGKMAIRFGLAKMAARGGRAGGVLGAMGALGQPVRVMNWHEARFAMGGMGMGGAAAPGAAAAPAARGGWAAKAGKVFGTLAGVALLASAPSIGKSLGDWITEATGLGETEAQAKKRFNKQDAAIKSWQAKGGLHKRTEADIEGLAGISGGTAGSILDMLSGGHRASMIAQAQWVGMGERFKAAKGTGRTLMTGERVGGTTAIKREEIGPLMTRMFSLVQAGRAVDAKKIWGQTGLAKLQTWAKFAGNDPEEAKKLGLTDKMVSVLENFEVELKRQREAQEKPVKVVVNVDGRQIAVANRTAQIQSRERAGKPPGAGERRRAAQAGY
jgi:TP901 family phage tail tape measure protein